MKLRYLNEVFYDDLKDKIEENIDLYRKESPFIFDLYDGKEFFKESNIVVNEINLNFKNNGKYDDYLCALSLYNNLSSLSLTQACNPFLWTYLCHTDGWDYMRERWPIDGNDKENINRVKSRYIASNGNNRSAIFRNGLSRLWWGVYISIDESSANKYRLTKMLFSEQDLFVSVVERDYSMCKNVIQGILDSFCEYNDMNGCNVPLEIRRELLKHINRVGGLTSLDLLSREDIKSLCNKYIEEHSIL